MFYDPNNISKNETICALATPAGNGAIAIIRISGPLSIEIASNIFFSAHKKLAVKNIKSHRIHYGMIKEENEIIDDVLLSIFRAPNSYTGEDSVEISCHGSNYIQQRILELVINKGARAATAGEFTFRAFMNGKFDLSQAEAVADLIAATSSSAHQLAIDQMRGGYSQKIKLLRQKLVDFASLLELELDFGEEDVEFANRAELMSLLDEMKTEISKLIESFRHGNVMKHGIPVAIIGKPNVGKSTLLNAILNEEKAIVSEIPGTTRDVIEDTITINGVSFRFIDTAGLRESFDTIESIGIERTREKIAQASIILYVFDISETSIEDLNELIEEYQDIIKNENKKLILVANKIDQLIEIPHGFTSFVDLETIFISAKRKENINEISDLLLKNVDTGKFSQNTIVSNARHYDSLNKVLGSLESVKSGFESHTPTDLISIDIRQALHYLGEITGQVTTDELLGNIFGKFCIGK